MLTKPAEFSLRKARRRGLPVAVRSRTRRRQPPALVPAPAASAASAAASGPTFVQQASAHGAGKSSISVTPGASAAAGDRLVVEVGIWKSSGATTSSVTDSSGDQFRRGDALHRLGRRRDEHLDRPGEDRRNGARHHRHANGRRRHGHHRAGVLRVVHGQRHHRRGPGIPFRRCTTTSAATVQSVATAPTAGPARSPSASTTTPASEPSSVAPATRCGPTCRPDRH